MSMRQIFLTHVSMRKNAPSYLQGWMMMANFVV